MIPSPFLSSVVPRHLAAGWRVRFYLTCPVMTHHFPAKVLARGALRPFSSESRPGNVGDLLKESLDSSSARTKDWADVPTFSSQRSGTGAAEVRPSLGTSSEDAFGEVDAIVAAADAARSAKDNEKDGACRREVEAKREDANHSNDEAAMVGRGREGLDATERSSRKRRRRRMRSVDTILGDVIHDALRLRDMGHKPSPDFVYKRTQERMYEEEYGRKPPGTKEFAANYAPFPPDIYLRRLFPLYEEPLQVGKPCLLSFVPPDPWPERAITAENPVWSRRQVEEDAKNRGGKGLKEWEERMFSPRKGFDLLGELTDAMDELRYWTDQFVLFLREVPITQRRTLPFLHEWHRLLVHRLIRAERRYERVRDANLTRQKVSTVMFKRTEEPLERVRELYTEAHRSLSSPNYDPLRMKKSVLAPFMRMTDQEFEVWKNDQIRQQNAIIADLS